MRAPIATVIKVLKQETREATQRFIVETAKREHAKVMKEDPPPESFSRFVDGTQGAAEETVRPDGTIIYRYRRLKEVVEFALTTLRELSPVLKGEYIAAHKLYLNGRPVLDIDDFQAGDHVMIVNSVPYSRMIEFGKMKMRVPGSSRVYQQAEILVQQRYGNVANVKYTLSAVLGGMSVNQEKAASSGKSWWLGHDGIARSASGVVESTVAKRFGKSAHNASDVRWPSLVISER